MKASFVHEPIQSEPSPAPSRERHLRAVKAPEGPRRTRTITIAVVLGVVVAMISGGLVYLWQHDQVADRATQLETAQLRYAEALRQQAALQDRIGELGLRIQQRAGRAGGLAVRMGELRTELSSARAETAALRAENSMFMGPPLPDGRYIGRIYAVGATQDPPRLVFDKEQWTPGDEGFGTVWNRTPLWQTVRVDPSTRVWLSQRPHHVGVVDFQRMFNRDSPWKGPIAFHHYWMTVSGGRVVAIRQQYPIGA